MSDEAEVQTIDSGADVAEAFANYQKTEAGEVSNDVAGDTVERSNGADEIQPDGNTVESAKVQSWDQTPLPADHWGREKGFKTVADLENSYKASSSEARSWQEQARNNQAINEGMREIVKQLQEQRAAAQPAKPAGYLGYADQKTFERAYAEDSNKAMAQVVANAIKSNPDIAKGIVDPHLQPLYEQRHQERLQSHYQNLVGKYAEAKDGTPEHNATAQLIESNPWVVEAAKSNPNVNFAELMFKAANYDLLAQKVKATDTKLVDKRAKSATVKTGTNAKAVRAEGATREDNIRAAIAHLAEQGHNFPESMIKGMTQALDHNLS